MKPNNYILAYAIFAAAIFAAARSAPPSKSSARRERQTPPQPWTEIIFRPRHRHSAV